MGFVQAGLLKQSLEEGSIDLSTLSKVAPLDADDLQVLRLLFDERMGGSIDGPLNWYRTRKVNYEEEKGELASICIDGHIFSIVASLTSSPFSPYLIMQP
jgi:hypothetical protein